MRIAVILLLMLAAALPVRAARPEIGMSAGEVVAQHGAPQSTLTREHREIYLYPEFEVTFVNGRVTKIEATRRKPAPAAEGAMPVAPVATVPGPPEPVAPAQADSTPITARGIAVALWPFYLVIAVIALAPFVPALRRARRRWYYRHAAAVPAPVPPAAILTQSLTPELLSHLEWKRFALLVRRFYEASQAAVTVSDTGANGEVTLLVAPDGPQPPFAVWCLPWGARQVNAAAMREFRGSMALLNQDEGRVITMAEFSADAIMYGAANHIAAISGPGFCDRFALLPESVKETILTEVTAGDFTTPTCPHCDVKLVRATNEVRFWSCVNTPRCRTRIYIR